MEPVPRVSRYTSARARALRISCLRFNRKCNIGDSITEIRDSQTSLYIAESGAAYRYCVSRRSHS